MDRTTPREKEPLEYGVIPSFYGLLTTLYNRLVWSLERAEIQSAYTIAKSLIGIMRLGEKERKALLDEIDRVFKIGLIEGSINECEQLEEEMEIKSKTVYGNGREGCFIVICMDKPCKIIYYGGVSGSRSSAIQEAEQTIKAYQWEFILDFVSRKLAPLIQSELEYYRSIEVYEQQ